MKFYRTLTLGLFSANLLFSSDALAAHVAAVKGSKALIDLEGDTAEPGDEFFLVSPDSGKKTAIIRISQVKGEKALAEVLKGQAQTNHTLQAKASSSEARPQTPSGSPSSNGKFLATLKDSYGITGSFIMNSMNANVSYKEPLGTTLRSNTDMKGYGLGVGGYYDFALKEAYVARVFAGIEQFVVSGSSANAACSGSTNCDAKINYLSTYGLGKWYFKPGPYRSWLGGGLGFLLALSKDSSALNTSQISTNQVYTLAIGTDIQLSRLNYVPVSLEYNLFPDSSTVKASMLVIKAGWAWNL